MAAMNWRERLRIIIFESDTPAGRAFDVALLWAILLSVTVVILDSVASVQVHAGPILHMAEWFFTAVFTCEYILRIYASNSRKTYATSFFGVIDFLAVLPTYASLFFPGAQSLLLVRALRLLRLFRILKLGRYSREAQILMAALKASREKISVFLYGVLTVVVVVGALMYFVEGEHNGFANIPISMYWAIVTMTTVGYGDLTPHTALGRFIASGLMILGYGLIAVPTGIVSIELAEATRNTPPSGGRRCAGCASHGHLAEARFCLHCGKQLEG
jgi:voltage-gated potassium channel